MNDEPPIHVVVAGLWHLGSVTAACCARHFQVTALDTNPETVANLSQGKPPLFEPGLAELVTQGIKSGRLRFTVDVPDACRQATVFWATYDTPVDDQDVSDVKAILDQLRLCLPHLPANIPVLISSQLPAGTCRLLEQEFPAARIICVPENLRLGKAIAAFENPGRVIVGVRDKRLQPLIARLFRPFCQELIWMRTESAEMVKHALNAFLAMSVSFINEIARVCEATGADAAEVANGLKTDARIGPQAYLSPGAAFAGGTLARDVVSLSTLGRDAGLRLIPAIKTSNDEHRQWALRRLEAILRPLAGRTVAILGLTYKPGTSTLRRSAAIELIQELLKREARVRAYDPVVRDLPTEFQSVELSGSLEDVLRQADAAVLCTEWPELRDQPWPRLISAMSRPLLLDPNRFLEPQLKNLADLAYLSVGSAP